MRRLIIAGLLMATLAFLATGGSPTYTPTRASTTTVETNAFNDTYIVILAPYTNGVTLQQFVDSLIAGDTQHLHYAVVHNGMVVSNNLSVSSNLTVSGALTAGFVTAGTGTYYSLVSTNVTIHSTLTVKDITVLGSITTTNTASTNTWSGNPNVALATNMLSGSWPSGAGDAAITNSTYLNAFDGNTNTWTSWGVIRDSVPTGSEAGTIRLSLGSRYRGTVYIEGQVEQTGAAGSVVLFIGVSPAHPGYDANDEPVLLSDDWSANLSDASAHRFCTTVNFDSAAEVYIVLRRNNASVGTETARIRFNRIELYGTRL